MKIIFAQGNPGPTYDHTRHNIGFFTLNQLANTRNLTWTEKTKFNAIISEAIIADEKVLLVKPTTFYNETGISARKLIDFYNLDAATDLLVIHDDLALPLGTIRTRQRGSDAGNNGIKSLNSHLGEDYHRIRIGIYNDLRDRIDDADFVLGRFSSEENVQLETVVNKVIDLIISFVTDELIATTHVK